MSPRWGIARQVNRVPTGWLSGGAIALTPRFPKTNLIVFFQHNRRR
jgi:hypothetical protein